MLAAVAVSDDRTETRSAAADSIPNVDLWSDLPALSSPPPTETVERDLIGAWPLGLD